MSYIGIFLLCATLTIYLTDYRTNTSLGVALGLPSQVPAWVTTLRFCMLLFALPAGIIFILEG